MPEYSPALPLATPRQFPVHRAGALDADHAPLATGLPRASTSDHVPVTVPLAESGTAVHVPMSVRPALVLALQLPDRLFCALLAES